MAMVRRFVTLALVAAVGLIGPGAVGSAVARPLYPSDHGGTSAFWSTATPEQKAGVQKARQAYLSGAWDVRRGLRTQSVAIRTTMDTTLDPYAKAVWLAKDALAFAAATGGDVAGAQAAYDTAKADYRTAADSARSTAKAAYDKALADARTALAGLRDAYAAAVTALFPGVTVPEQVLNPPGGRGAMGMGMGMGMGRR